MTDILKNLSRAWASVTRGRRIRATIVLSVLMLVVGYQTINAFVPNADMILATRTLAAGFYGVVLYVYGRDGWSAMRTAYPKHGDFLIVGICLSFLSHMGQAAYSIVYRLAPSEWLLNSEIVSPIVLLSVIGAVLHVSAPGAIDGVVPRRNRIALGIGVGIAVVAVTALLATRPDIRPIIERARPYIGDWFKTGFIMPGVPPA